MPIAIIEDLFLRKGEGHRVKHGNKTIGMIGMDDDGKLVVKGNIKRVEIE